MISVSRRAALRSVLAIVAAPLVLTRTTMTHAQGAAPMRIRISFNDQTMTATLEDNPSARDFASMLPLAKLTIDNYANNEKISYLPRKLTEEDSGPFGNERPGDLCYYAPWQSRLILCRISLVARPDPARPHRRQLRSSAGAGKISPQHRTHFLNQFFERNIHARNSSP